MMAVAMRAEHEGLYAQMNFVLSFEPSLVPIYNFMTKRVQLAS